ncbi:peritrophin-1-like protein [Leptotrombidium deliense]|uniref:Peritrophin-1-like protein n=1 Tax=Leptotrombidium deliense TaxID=299467 RepID=A0A443SHH6_9ACAR|nr:peritrophin-1-like protein [Leptotrombidium deliense]
MQTVHCQCEGLRDGFYPDSEQCDRFVKCESGKQVKSGLCPDGLVFNNYGALSKPRCMFRHEADCSKYKHCDNGVAFEGSCPDGLSFSQEYGICDWAENVPGCAAQNSVGFQCPEFNAARYPLVGNPRFPDKEDCRKFYVCIATFHDNNNYVMSPRHLACEYGRVFDSKTNECDEVENVIGW